MTKATPSSKKEEPNRFAHRAGTRPLSHHSRFVMPLMTRPLSRSAYALRCNRNLLERPREALFLGPPNQIFQLFLCTLRFAALLLT